MFSVCDAEHELLLNLFSYLALLLFHWQVHIIRNYAQELTEFGFEVFHAFLNNQLSVSAKARKDTSDNLDRIGQIWQHDKAAASYVCFLGNLLRFLCLSEILS